MLSALDAFLSSGRKYDQECSVIAYRAFFLHYVTLKMEALRPVETAVASQEM